MIIIKLKTIFLSLKIKIFEQLEHNCFIFSTHIMQYVLSQMIQRYEHCICFEHFSQNCKYSSGIVLIYLIMNQFIKLLNY